MKPLEFDYSPYLGPNYLKKHHTVKQASTLVSNHFGYYDNFAICRFFPANFIVSDVFRTMPLMGKLYTAVGSVFVNITSNSSQEQRNKVVEIIKYRQEFAEGNIDSNPVCIFPEGSVSNGRYILPFKRGAFEACKSIKPLVLKYEFNQVSPQLFEPLQPFLILLLICLWNSASVTIYTLPTFIPNHYLFETHKDKGE